MRADRRYKGKRVITPSDKAVSEVNVTADGEIPCGEAIRQEERKFHFWHDYGYLLITVIVVVVLCRGIFQLAFVPTGSMETTIPTHSFLIAWRLPYLVSDPFMDRGDVAIFWDEEMGRILVKRVIGTSGETVSFKGGYTYINGEKIDESYLPEQGITQCEESFSVPEESLFMMGDNRTGSFDSRYLDHPYIPLGAVQGKALVCIPLKQITLFASDNYEGIHLYLPLFGQTHTL